MIVHSNLCLEASISVLSQVGPSNRHSMGEV